MYLVAGVLGMFVPFEAVFIGEDPQDLKGVQCKQ